MARRLLLREVTRAPRCQTGKRIGGCAKLTRGGNKILVRCKPWAGAGRKGSLHELPTARQFVGVLWLSNSLAVELSWASLDSLVKRCDTQLFYSGQLNMLTKSGLVHIVIVW